jgi:pyridinium-3,5-biscarboxylic acid mononucleotide synthase
MDIGRIRALLENVRSGTVSTDQALAELRDLPFRDLGFASVDHHRSLRTGAPEVILGEPKTAEQIGAIATEIARMGQNVFITRLAAEKAAAVREKLPDLVYAPLARTATVEVAPIRKRPGSVGIVTAGTGDLPVAEEAAETLRVLGIEVVRIYDVGVAGIHRLLDKKSALDSCVGVIVVAGMEGALPSVVGGLVGKPIIGVPTSVGYGANLFGFTSLLGMLTSCASGLSVVNIDNGFGAAMAMGRMLPPAEG